MKYIDLINTAISLDKALELITANNKSGYEWYSIKLDNGFYLELGGNVIDNILNIKAYIPEIIDDKIIVFENGFVESLFSIEWRGMWNDSIISLSNKYIKTDIMDLQTFILVLANCDKITERMLCHESCEIFSIKKLNF